MRVTLLIAAVLLSLQTCFAAVPMAVSQPADPAAAPPGKNIGHDKKKGTIGFLSGLFLGPVGLGGVYLFSHNHAQRKAAKKGCVIFTTVVVAAALCWLIVVLAAKSGTSPNVGSGSSRSGSGGGSGSGRSGGSGGSSGSGGGAHSSGGHTSNSDWANNINWPGGPASTSPKKKPVPGALPSDFPTSMIIFY